jgi:hypothetical protein
LHGFSPLGEAFEPPVSGLLFQRFASGRGMRQLPPRVR